MHGRLAAAQGVVVHRRQVVVHERVGVHQFDRGGGRVEHGLVGAERGAGRVDVQGLAAAHAGRTGGDGQFAQHRHAPCVGDRRVGQQFEGQ